MKIKQVTLASGFCGKFYGVTWNMLFTGTALLAFAEV